MRIPPISCHQLKEYISKLGNILSVRENPSPYFSRINSGFNQLKMLIIIATVMINRENLDITKLRLVTRSNFEKSVILTPITKHVHTITKNYHKTTFSYRKTIIISHLGLGQLSNRLFFKHLWESKNEPIKWTNVFSYRQKMLHRVCGFIIWNIPVILQVASLLAALTHPSHIVIYAPGEAFSCRRTAT